ncbi:MAG TPA: NADH-quinone oxidoreductase subunit NuoH [Thermoleophilia bacterium]|nr:NADH-quinone oxidoreductase subunit NuoH [Thermoleophilia bacterium]HZK48981.1 NADH-quinone oxidoreductase subunit NuoH [Thermoleophilia bacterium]
MTDLIFLVVKGVLWVVVAVGMVPFIIYFERKFAGFFQSRVGPTYAGPFGALQSFGDMAKLLSKEDLIPDWADKPVFRIAPYILFVPAFVTMALIPFGPMGVSIFGHKVDLVIANFDAGAIMFLALGSIAVYGIVFAGWASNNHWSLLGSLRSGAQMVSYEISMGLALVGLFIMAGSVSFVGIVDAQAGNFWNWNFIPQIVGFAIFFVASIAELNRAPFDLAEAEQELVAGHMTEYTGMRWGIFMFGEYVNMVVVSAVIATLFFGGWRPPFEALEFIPGFIWLVGKVLFFVFMYMWIRWTLPRYRYNQLMDIGWKVFLPLALANLVVTALIVSVV